MAIVLQGTPSVYENASAASVIIPYPTGVTAGELLVVTVTDSSATAPATNPGGWTLAKSQAGPTTAPSTAVWYKIAAGTETGSVTFATNATVGRVTGTMSRWSGVDNTTPIDVAGVSASSATASTFTMPTITTATANAMLIHAISLNASASADIDTLAGTTKVTGSTGTGRRQSVFSETRATAGATGTRVWSMTPATPTLQWAGITIALRPSSGGVTAPALVQRVVGIPDTNTSTSARIQVKTTNATSVRLKIGTNTAVTTGVVFGAAATPSANGDATLTATGLTANTRYYYRVEMTDTAAGTSLDTGTVGSFKTAPTGQASFAFDFGSCTNASDSASLAAIATRADDLFFHLGDLYYADASGTGLQNFRDKMNAKITVANHASVFSTINSSYTPSDHDGMNNNGAAGADATAWANWNTARSELFPMPASYYAFTWGRVRFVQLDTRSFKTIPSATDNSSKTALGATQKQWLKDQITNATEPVIVIIQADPWIGAAVAGDDSWPGYTTERTELASHFSASGKNIVMLAGDMHAVAADDGTNAPGGIAVFQAAPLNNNASIKGGPYSVSPYPASGTAVVQQYGRCVVTDSGSSIALAFTGYSSDNTSRVALTKTYTLSLALTASASFSGSGTLTATAAPSFSASASFSGSGSLAASGTPQVTVTRNFTGSGTLSSNNVVNVGASGSLSGSGTLTASTTAGRGASGDLSGSGTLTASAVKSAAINVGLSGSGTLSATPAKSSSITANLSGQGTLTGTATKALAIDGTLSGSGTLTGFATQDMLVNFSGSGTLSATAKPSASVNVVFSGSGTLTGSAGSAKAVSVGLSSTGTLSASATSTSYATGTLSGAGTLSSAVSSTRSVAATLTSTGTLTVAVHNDSGQNIQVNAKLATKPWDAYLTTQRWKADLGES